MDHECEIPQQTGIWGEVRRCPECGTEWLARVALDPELIEWEQRDPSVTAEQQAVRSRWSSRG